MRGAIPPLTLRLHGAVLINQRDKFTFLLLPLKFSDFSRKEVAGSLFM
jgi:hypothetical protein